MTKAARQRKAGQSMGRRVFFVGVGGRRWMVGVKVEGDCQKREPQFCSTLDSVL